MNKQTSEDKLVETLRKATYDKLHAGVQEIKNGGEFRSEGMLKIQHKMDTYIAKCGWSRYEYQRAYLAKIVEGLGDPINAKAWAEDDK